MRSNFGADLKSGIMKSVARTARRVQHRFELARPHQAGAGGELLHLVVAVGVKEERVHPFLRGSALLTEAHRGGGVRGDIDEVRGRGPSKLFPAALSSAL